MISGPSVYLAVSLEPSWYDEFYMSFEDGICHTSWNAGDLKDVLYSILHGRMEIFNVFGRREMLFVVLCVEAIGQVDHVP